MGHDCSPFHPFLSNAELTAWLVYFTVSPLRRRLYFETCCQVSFWALRWWESWQYCQLAIDVQMLWCKLEKRRCTDTSAQRTTGIAIQDHGKQQGQLQRPFQHVMREIVASSITWCLGIKGGGTATFAVGVKGWVICTTVTDRLGNDSTNFKNRNIRFLRSQQTEKAERENENERNKAFFFFFLVKYTAKRSECITVQKWLRLSQYAASMLKHHR